MYSQGELGGVGGPVVNLRSRTGGPQAQPGQQQHNVYQAPNMPNQGTAAPIFQPQQPPQQPFHAGFPAQPAGHFANPNQSIAAASGFYTTAPPSSSGGVNAGFPAYPSQQAQQQQSALSLPPSQLHQQASTTYAAPHPQQQHAIFQTQAPGELGVSFGDDSGTQREDIYTHGVGGGNRGLSMRGSSPPMAGQAYNRSSPTNAAGGSQGMHRTNSSGQVFDSSDDRLRRKQNVESLQHYRLFMYGMCSLAAFAMVVAWMTLGSASTYVALVLSICIFSFVFTLKLTEWIFSKDDANSAMRVISEAIREGSEGFLKVQYTAIASIASIIAVLIGIIYLFREAPSKEISQLTLAIVTSISYLIGAFCSGLAGYIGVWVSIRVNIRVAVAASKFSFKDALLLSFRGGAVSACLSASLCILGVTVLYVFCSVFFVYFGNLPARHVPLLLVGYGFGGALVALFMQLGGGIYTKAADVGADMCGKVEANIPEDDPRNPAVIADLVGDNVGDCAGSMSDVFESIAAEVIGTMILGAALAHEANLTNPEPWIFFPLVIHALDLVISSVGIMLTIPTGDKEDPLDTMKRAYGVCMVLAAVGFMATCYFLLSTPVAPMAWWYYTLCGWIGIVMSFCIIRSTQYYTDAAYAPVKRIAAASQTGSGTNVIAGISVGLESTCFPTLVIAVALIAAFSLGKASGLPGNTAGVFGTAVATMGMLCTAVFVLSMNNFGPIADNAGGIVEMSAQPHEVRVITDRLDSVGNVTKAASKGYAVGGSALSCFVLFQAFLDEISSYSGVPFDVVNIAKVEVVCGGLLGMMMIFLFSGWSMQSVGVTAQKVVWEVRRQFKSRPGIMDGTEKPDYRACVAIVTSEALKEMVWPALLALLLPIIVGFGFKWFGAYTGRPNLGVEVVAGFMMMATLAGLLMATFMDNAGGAWDNAKKLIESQGQKGTEAHKAAVTGDTVGDPCLLPSTLLALADGGTVMAKDVAIGDVLFGTSGPVTVLATASKSNAIMYDITDATGFTFTVTAAHLVTLVWTHSTTVDLVQRKGRDYRSLRITWYDRATLTQQRHSIRVQLTSEKEDAELIECGWAWYRENVWSQEVGAVSAISEDVPVGAGSRLMDDTVRGFRPFGHATDVESPVVCGGASLLQFDESEDEVPDSEEQMSALKSFKASSPPLQRGDLVEIQASELAKPERLRYLQAIAASPLARLQRVTLPSEVRGSALSSSSSDADAVPSQSSSYDAGKFESEENGTLLSDVSKGDVCEEFAQIALDAGKYRAVNSDDRALVGYMLHNSLESRARLSMADEKAFTIHQLERAWDVLSMTVGAADGVLVTELNPIAPKAAEEYSALCLQSMQAMLDTGVKAIVAFGGLASARWKNDAMKLHGVAKVDTKIDDADLCWRTTLTLASGRTVSVFESPHPCMSAHFLQVALAVRAAHRAAGDVRAAAPVTAQLRESLETRVDGLNMMVSLKSVSPSVHTDYVRIEVDGDHRFALANGIITHNCKDTAGPALHVIITTLSTSVLVLGPFLATAAGVKN